MLNIIVKKLKEFLVNSMGLSKNFDKSMNFENPEAIPAIEWAPYWNRTIERWNSEGLPMTLKKDTEIHEFFGLDIVFRKRIRGIGENYTKNKEIHKVCIKSETDYLHLKKNLFCLDDINTKEFEMWSIKQQQGKALIWLSLDGFFWFPRTLFGIEDHMYSFYDHPDLMKKMNTDLLDYNLNVLKIILSVCKPNFICLSEDMSYNHGSMLSKNTFDEFLAPSYQIITSELKKQNIKIFVDSDGDVKELIPWLIEVGVDGILPLERVAGVDVSEIRRENPQFNMIGGFDKTVMHLGKESMVEEFERLLPAIRQGGFIPSVDHQTPPDVSVENYRVYVSLLREYCNKAFKN